MNKRIFILLFKTKNIKTKKKTLDHNYNILCYISFRLLINFKIHLITIKM